MNEKGLPEVYTVNDSYGFWNELPEWITSSERHALRAAFASGGVAAGAYRKEKLKGIICAAEGRSLHISCMRAEKDDKTAAYALLCYIQRYAALKGIGRIKIHLPDESVELQALLCRLGYRMEGRAVNVLASLNEENKERVSGYLARCRRYSEQMYKRGFEERSFFETDRAEAKAAVELFLPEYPFLRGVFENKKIDARSSRLVWRNKRAAAFCVVAPLEASRDTAVVEYLGALHGERNTGAAFVALTGALCAVCGTGRYKAAAFSFREDNQSINGILRAKLLRICGCTVKRTDHFVKYIEAAE